MIEQTRTFRVFVSSTFSDLRAERDALQERVFPRLRALCAERGAQFQAIDLRWGISEEASLDQQTMNICLGEIERCQEKSPRPNFLVLLGDRYGWWPPPPQVPATVLEKVLQRATVSDRELVLEWYLRDENAVPPEYCLRSRNREAEGGEAESWGHIESRLQSVLANAADHLDLDALSCLPLVASATHQEIALGALRVEDAHEHVCCFFRSIKGLPQDRRAADYLDLGDDGCPDSNAQERLRRLKQELRARLPDNVFEYKAEWEYEEVTQHHVEPLCRDVYEQLSRLIIQETPDLEERDNLQVEVENHDAFGRERARFFVGRTGTLQVISDYLAGEGKHPLVVVGASGLGKTALMAEAVERAKRDHPGAEVVSRFLGSTPDSSVGRKLLEGLCRQLDRSFGRDGPPVPAAHRESVEAFGQRLSLATATKPIILFIDALDQLTDAKDERGLSWIRAQLPAHVHLVVSTIPGRYQEILEARLLEKSVVELPPMPGTDAEVLLDLWLENAHRTLREDQRREVLMGFERCPSPLYLRLVFEDARRWKSYGKSLPETETQPDYHEDVQGVLRELFGRLSSEAHHGEIFVSRSLAYLAAGKNGLSEEELLDVLAGDVEVLTWFLRSTFHTPPHLLRHAEGYLNSNPEALDGPRQGSTVDSTLAQTWLEQIRRDPDATWLNTFLSTLVSNGVRLPLPVVLWSRLYFDLEPYLAPRSSDGAVTYRFFHRQVQEVVTEDYLNHARKKPIHQALAAYFKNQDLEIAHEKGTSPNRRKLSELPFQEARAEAWDDLSSTLSHFPFLQTKVKVGGPQPLIDDFEEAFRLGCPGRVLPMIQKALRLSANVLAENPLQLPGHIIGRLMVQPEDEVQALLNRVREWNDVEWLCPLTPNLSHLDEPLLRTIDGHRQMVTAVAGHPDGNGFISASSDGTLRYWDLNTGEELAVSEENSAPITAVAMFPDGRECLSGSEDGSLTHWNVGDLTVLRRFEGHEEAVQSIAVVPGRGQAISGSSDGTLRLWDVVAGSAVRTFEGHIGGVNTVAIFAGGSHAISGSTDGTLRIWDLEDGRTLSVLSGHTGPVNAVVVLPDGQRALSGQGHSGSHVSRNLKVWDLNAGKEIQTLTGRTWDVKVLRLMPDGERGLAAISDGTIKVFDLESGKVTGSLEGHGGEVNDLALSPDGNRLISGSSDGTVKVWDMDSRGSLVAGPDFSLPDDLRALQQRKLLNRTLGKGTHALSTEAVAIFPNRRRAVSITYAGTAGPDGMEGVSRLAIWDLATGLRVRSLELDGTRITSLEIFPDGGRAIVTSGRNTFQIVDLKSGNSLDGPAGHTGGLTHVALVGAGEFAVTASHDGTVRIWHLDARIPAGILAGHMVLEGHKATVNHVSIFPDKKRLVSASDDRTLMIWDLKTMRPSLVLKGHESEVTATLALADGNRIVSASRDGVINTWDAGTGRLLGSLEGHRGAVTGLAVLGPVGSFVSASVDRSLKVWDLAEGRVRSTFMGEGQFICCAAEGAGDTVIAGDDSGRVHILRLKESRAALNSSVT